MNVLGLIFSVLLVFSLSLSAIFEKQIGAERLCKTYVGHINANRKIFCSYEKECYASLHLVRSTKQAPRKKKPPRGKKGGKSLVFPTLNPPCARLNLWPLVHEGEKTHPLLYRVTADLFKEFYGKALFEGKARAEVAFLDVFLQELRLGLQKDPSLQLEKLEFKDPALRQLYYRMLKGTKGCNFFKSEQGYPPLLDYIKIDPIPSKACLFHAHPHLTLVFFGPKVALALHSALHTKKPHVLLSQELLETFCSDARVFISDKKIFDLLNFTHLRQRKVRAATFAEEDMGNYVSLRQTLDLKA